MQKTAIRISQSGSGALLLDAAVGAFSDDVQHHLWEMDDRIRDVPGVIETALGMNNVLVIHDPLLINAVELERILRSLWLRAQAKRIAGTSHTLAVFYGGDRGEDLLAWAEHCRMTVQEVVQRHTSGIYTVAAIGGMPGFPYLSGLDPALAWPRRAIPKSGVMEGSVIIGAGQASVMPITAPSGWHILGHTNTGLFDPSKDPPALLQVGDTVRFAIAAVVI